MKFKKRPEIVEAVQLNAHNRDRVYDLLQNGNPFNDEPLEVSGDGGGFWVPFGGSGSMTFLGEGAWLLKDGFGNLRVEDDNWFRRQYEPLSEGDKP